MSENSVNSSEMETELEEDFVPFEIFGSIFPNQ